MDAMGSLDKLNDSIKDAWDRAAELSKDNKTVVSVLGAGVLVLGASWLLRPSKDKKKPSASQLTGGSIGRAKVKKEFDDYAKSYSTDAGAGIIERSKTTELVDTFYNLVTDIYEWGWGQVCNGRAGRAVRNFLGFCICVCLLIKAEVDVCR